MKEGEPLAKPLTNAIKRRSCSQHWLEAGLQGTDAGVDWGGGMLQASYLVQGLVGDCRWEGTQSERLGLGLRGMYGPVTESRCEGRQVMDGTWGQSVVGTQVSTQPGPFLLFLASFPLFFSPLGSWQSIKKGMYVLF